MTTRTTDIDTPQFGIVLMIVVAFVAAMAKELMKRLFGRSSLANDLSEDPRRQHREFYVPPRPRSRVGRILEITLVSLAFGLALWTVVYLLSPDLQTWVNDHVYSQSWYPNKYQPD